VKTEGTLSTDVEVSDEELMRQLAGGCPEALGPLHTRYASLIDSLASRVLDRDAGEEVSQEVFFTVWRHARTFDPSRGSFRTWVLRITRSIVLNELRSRGRRPRAKVQSNGTNGDHLPDPGPDPADAAWHEHRRAAVLAAVDALPAPQREALSLAFLEERTHEQVAALLNLPLGTAKSRIRSGLKALRGSLAPLIGAGLVLAGFLTLAGLREHAHRAELQRQGRALALVTNSEVVPRRLGAEPGIDPAAHGNYRGRPGVDLAVLTVSYLAPPPRGQDYRAWASHGGRWTPLGRVAIGPDGRGLIIAESPALATPPDEVRLTLEPEGAPIGPGAAPTGRPILRWPAR
jgi:RNA polymerase sigma-70 factor (ECF subfamily)